MPLIDDMITKFQDSKKNKNKQQHVTQLVEIIIKLHDNKEFLEAMKNKDKDFLRFKLEKILPRIL